MFNQHEYNNLFRITSYCHHTLIALEQLVAQEFN